MGTYYRAPRRTMSFGGFTLTPAVKVLLIVNACLYVFPAIFGFNIWATFRLWLRPVEVIRGGAIWQPFTYMFFHGGFTHFLFNMLTLWMFGTAVEQTWGTRRFAYYYMACGVVAGLTVVVTAMISGSLGDMLAPTIGSSGAIFGLILAFGILFPDVPILLFFLFPIPAKYFAMIMAGIEFFLQKTSPGSGVSHWAHLGGMAFGLFYIKVWMPRQSRRPRFKPAFRAPVFDDEPDSAPWYRYDFKDAYRRWKMRRARKKFEVYMRKNQGQGPWVN